MAENEMLEYIDDLARRTASAVCAPPVCGSPSLSSPLIAAALHNVRAEEREECAKVVECFIPASQDSLSDQIAELCAIIAAAIRGGSHE